MHNLRIYMAIETFFPLVGGAEKQAFLQSKYLRTQGINTTIITMHYDQNWPMYEMLEGVPVVRVARNTLGWHECSVHFLRRFCYLLALLALGRQLWRRRNEYDVLHVFQLTLFALPALLVSRLAHKPLIIGMRCDSVQVATDDPAAGLSTKSWADLDGLVRLGKPALHLINRQLRSVKAQIIVLSPRMRASLSRCGIDGADVLLLPNGVDTDQFYPVSWEQKKALTVVCVARLRYQKGIDILLHAWCLLVREFPDARLLIVGNGPLLESLQDMAARLGITTQVEFTGLCLDVEQQLHRASIAVLPSRWEGMSNALLEAMSSGLVCVATRVSGSEDLLGHGERGLLVEPGDIADLAEALLCLLRKPELARHYGQEARKYVEQHHAFRQIMDRHMELYNDIIEKHRKVW